MRASGAALTLGAVWLVCAAACSDFEGDSPAATTTTPDASTDDAAAPAVTCDPACGPTETCRDGKCVVGCPESIVYVSAAGSDGNSGCAKAEPKKTVGGAIAFVKTLGLVGHEIHVCRGLYTEPPVMLDYPVSIRGGYECNVWNRVENFGFTGIDPTTGRAKPFDATNETVIASAGADNVLDVSGAALGRAVMIEGITFQPRAKDGGITIKVHGGASPVFAHDLIRGAGPGQEGNDIGSQGIEVADDAAPEIKSCVIDGGEGGTANGNNAASSFGSIAVHLHTSGKVLLHDNVIDAGNGVGGNTGAIGVFVKPPTSLDGDDALARNSIFYGGTASLPILSAACGVLVIDGARADVIENRVIGGQAKCPTINDACSMYGIAIDNAAKGTSSGSRVLRNRILGGDGTASTTKPYLYSIQLGANATGVDVFDNLVDIGTGAIRFGINAAIKGGTRRIVHNTIASAGSTPATQSVAIQSNGLSTEINDNLLVGTDAGIVFGDCTLPKEGDMPAVVVSPPIATQNNAFVAVGILAKKGGGPTCPNLTAVTVTDADNTLPNSGNTTVALQPKPCAPDVADRCKVCSGPDACASDLFANAASFPRLINAEWKLKPGGWCKLLQGASTARLSLVPMDAAGVTWTPPPSIGALETDGTCAPQ